MGLSAAFALFWISAFILRCASLILCLICGQISPVFMLYKEVKRKPKYHVEKSV